MNGRRYVFAGAAAVAAAVSLGLALSTSMAIFQLGVGSKAPSSATVASPPREPAISSRKLTPA